MNDLLLNLEKLGLSSYEAKALIALFQKHPANGYEVSKLARIPPSKVYETLSRLKNKGLAIADGATDPVQYYPIPREKLVHLLRRDYVATIEALAEDLQQLQPIPRIDLSWNLAGYPAVISKIIAVIENATELVMLSLWPDEFAIAREAVVRAESRGVKVIAGIFGDFDYHGPDAINLAPCGESSQNRLQSHLTVAVADSREVVISEIRADQETVGIWTDIPGIVLVAKEYIKHDLWGRLLINTLGEERFQRLIGDNDLLSFLIRNR